MKVKCDYCGNLYDDTLKNCSSCGAANNNVVRTNNTTPQTIEELAKWFSDNGYTAEKTRFFIGIDYREPKAFGIYKDRNGDCVVYKNKADGTRAIRYQGKDEAYAVNEIWLRFQTEIINQKNVWINKKQETARTSPSTRTRKTAKRVIRPIVGVIASFSPVIIILLLFLGVRIGSKIDHANDGYYSLNNELYYYYFGRGYYKYDILDETPNDDKGWYLAQDTKRGYGDIPREFWADGYDNKAYHNTDSINYSYFPFEDTATYASWHKTSDGYFTYNDNIYYRYDSKYYYYDEYNDDWDRYYGDWDDIYYNSTYSDWNTYIAENNFEYDATAFTDSYEYESIKASEKSSSSHDSDSGWPSSDWDSDSTDWDSDW